MEKSAISRQNLSIGTGTHLQKGVGTGTNQCGTGADASNSPDFCILVLLSLNSYSNSIRTLIDD